MNNTHPQSSEKSKKKILLVEDEQYIRELYDQVIQDAGYAVELAVDGNEAYTKITENTYDLILLDILLPKMDGLDVLEKIRDEGKKSDVISSVVLLTNLSQETVIARALSLGVRGYMVKSDYTPDQIIKEINQYVSADN